MRDDELRRLLSGQNPWWRAVAAGTDPTAWARDHRLFRDRADYDLGYRADVFHDLAVGPVTDSLAVLTGPRRVGKSVAVLELAEHLCSRGDVDPRRVIYLPCDGFTSRDLRRVLTLGRDLTRVVDTPSPERRVWLLDEVTGVPGWTTVLKSARDGTAFGDDTVVLTGSRLRREDDVQGKLLAGRAGTRSRQRVRILLPMSFRSFLAVSRPELAVPDPSDPADLQSHAVRETLTKLAFDVDSYDLAWQEYLTCGGFPRAVGEYVRTGSVSESFLRDLLSWIERDVDPDAAPQSVPRLLEEIARNMTSPLSIRSMAEVRSQSRTALASLLNRLVATFGALWVPRHEGGRPVDGAQSKIYLVDPLLAWLPTRLRAGLREPEMTTLTESAIGVAMAAAIDRVDEGRWLAGDTIGYVRTESGNEIDLGPVALPAASGARTTVPIESKWVDDGWRSEAKGLDGKYKTGILATKSVLHVERSVWAVPAPLVAVLLG